MQAKMNNWSGWTHITDPMYLREFYGSLLQGAGFRVLDICEHHFQPYGYTALFLLSESHFAIHTFPEEQKTYLELSSCIDGPFEVFLELHNMPDVAGA